MVTAQIGQCARINNLSLLKRVWHTRPMLDETDEIHPLFAGAPTTTQFKKLRKRIVR